MQITIKAKTVKIDYCGQDYLGYDNGKRLDYAYYACNDDLRADLRKLLTVNKVDRDDYWHAQRAQLIVRIEHCPIIKSRSVGV